MRETTKEFGFSWDVISVHPLGPLREHLSSNSINAIGCHYRGPLGLFSHLALRNRIHRQLLADRPILMTGPTITGLLSLPTRRRCGRVLCVHYHHEGVHEKWQWRLLYWLANSRFDLITFPSDFVRNEAISIFPKMKEKCLTVRNPVRIPDVVQLASDKARHELGIGDNVPVIGNAGWIIQRKRFDVFLDVAGAVLKEHPDAMFLIAGDGALREDMEKKAGEMGISGSIRFLGWQKDLSAFYQTIDILLFSTDWDAYPTTPIEAMSYGKPVVCSALNSGVFEIIDDSIGCCLRTHDVAGLSSFVCRLIKDPHLAKSLGAKARERVERNSRHDISILPIVNALTGLREGGGNSTEAILA